MKPSQQLSPFQAVFDRASKRLEMFFRRCVDKNAALFLDPGLDQVIGRIVIPTSIRNCYKNVFTYESNKSKFDYENITIFTSGDNIHLAQYVKLLSETPNPPGEITIIFANKFTYIARQFLEAHGFLHKISTEELRLPVWVLDSDLATIEMRNSASNILLEGGNLAIENMTQALQSFPVHTYFSNVFCIGESAIKIGDNLPKNFQSGWTHIFIFDRRADLLPLFLSTFTYESVVAENAEMLYGVARYSTDDAAVLFAQKDSISSSTRLLSISEAASQIKELSTTIKEEIESLKTQTSIAEKTKQLKEVANRVVLDNQSITNHLNLIEYVVNNTLADASFHPVINAEGDCITHLVQNPDDIINPAIALSKNWRQAVRLLATYCLTAKNIPDLTAIKTNIIDKFGLEPLAALWSLDEAGITVPTAKRQKAFAADKFKLYTPDVEVGPAVVYGGYYPLFLRLLTLGLKNDWSLASGNLDELQIPYRVYGNRCPEKRRALVCFVGGATYGEVTALRKNTSLGMAVDVLATDYYSTRRLLDELSGA